MKARTITLLLAMFIASTGLWAQQDPFIGTWKLNLAKSKYDPGPPPRSLTFKLEPSGRNGLKMTADAVDAQGKAIHTEYTANDDGKDYPITGSLDSDTVSVKRIDPYTRVRISKKGGNVVNIVRRIVSKDGKTYTAEWVGINARGQAFHDIAVYDKQ